MNSVLELLPNLSRSELKKTRAIVNDLLAGFEDGPDEDELFVAYRTIADRLPFPELSAFRRMACWKAFVRGLEVCANYIDNNFGEIAKTRRVGIWRVLIDTLLTQIQEEGIPVGPKVLAEHLKRIPEVMDYQFPGYRESGLLPATVDAQIITKRSVGDADGSVAGGDSFDTDP